MENHVGNVEKVHIIFAEEAAFPRGWGTLQTTIRRCLPPRSGEGIVLYLCGGHPGRDVEDAVPYYRFVRTAGISCRGWRPRQPARGAKRLLLFSETKNLKKYLDKSAPKRYNLPESIL